MKEIPQTKLPAGKVSNWAVSGRYISL